MIYDKYNELQELVSQGLVSARPHPTLPLTIYNYTKASVEVSPSDPRWLGALGDARGLVLETCNCRIPCDNVGHVIARGFRKFWNRGQVFPVLGDEIVAVREKMDGSLGIVFSYGGQLVVATRGSFESDQAKWAQAWFAENHPEHVVTRGLTELYEIVYPENRIVVDYKGFSGCVYLGVVNNLTGTPDVLAFEAPEGFTSAGSFAKDWYEKRPQQSNEEGYVVYYRSGFMEKVKFDEYCKLHKAIYGLSSTAIWEMMYPTELGKFFEVVDRLPTEELKSWALSTYGKLDREIWLTMCGASKEYARIKDLPTRKEFALEAVKYKHPQLLFSLLDNNDTFYRGAWKLCKPKHETPFRPAASDEE